MGANGVPLAPPSVDPLHPTGPPGPAGLKLRHFEDTAAPAGASPAPVPAPSPPLPDAPLSRDERDDLFALVAHELRNPLHALTLQLALARATAQSQPEGAVDPIAKAQRLLARYAERVTVMLDLVTLQPSAFPVRQVPVDVAELLRTLGDALAQDASFRGVELVVEAAQPVTLPTDPGLLEQVLDNLLLNAFKHAACRRVTLALRADETQVSIEVRDDGRGISPADQQRIFGKFGVATDAPRGTGSGLGLWIVRKLLAALGGGLDLASSPGAGSTFTVRLPLLPRPGPTA